MSLQQLLTWSDNEALLDEYQAVSFRKAEVRLVAAIRICQECNEGDAALLIDVLEDLPAGCVLSIACAPQLEYLVRGVRAAEVGSGEVARFLRESLQAELLLQDSSLDGASPGAVWTASGDRRIASGEGASAVNGEAGGPGPIGRAHLDAAITVGPGIPLDFLSPYHRGDLSFRFPEAANYDDGHIAALVSKLTAAFSLVRAAGGQVERFVKAFTTVIVPLRVDSANRWFGSFSSSWFPGRSVLVNAHLDEMSVHDAAAAIVHEAIHSLVDASELDGRLLISPRPDRPKVRSPWTGAAISLQSLLDAYFVWYGLMHFWKRVALRQDAAAEPCRRYIERCRRGFEPPFTDVVGADIGDVHPFVREAIESLRVVVGRERAA